MQTAIGLANLGNTCFLNVILQSLRVLPPIVELTLHAKPAFREKSKKKELAQAFQTLMRDFWKTAPTPGTCPTMVPRGFFHILHNVLRETGDDWYHPGQQADACEALQYILDSIHDAIYRQVKMEIVGKPHNEEESQHIRSLESWASFYAKEYSAIIQNFYGQTQISIVCDACKNTSERYEPWSMIKVPIPGANPPTLDACLAGAFETEELEDYHCEKCKTRGKAHISNKISRFPPVVILTIKRFTNAGHKISGKIVWDLENIDLSKYNAFQRDPFRGKSVHPVYTTMSVIEHHGSSNGGHYSMFTKQENEWYEYDDSSVRKVLPENVITADSYIAICVAKDASVSMYEKMESIIQTYRKS